MFTNGHAQASEHTPTHNSLPFSSHKSQCLTYVSLRFLNYIRETPLTQIKIITKGNYNCRVILEHRTLLTDN